MFADESCGGSGSALVMVDGLALVGVDDLGICIGRVVVAEVGVEEPTGVANGVESFDLTCCGGAHSAFSIRCTGLRLDKIDCTGGAEY